MGGRVVWFVVACAGWGAGCGDDGATADPGTAGGGGSGAATAGGGEAGSGGVPAAPTLVVVHAQTGEEATRQMYFEPIAVRVAGAAPGETLEIVARLGNFASHATFAASAEGAIDTSVDAPLEGTYEGVDVDGLVWSMEHDEAAGEPAFGDGPLRVELTRTGELLASHEVERLSVADGVERTDLPTATGLVGALFVPDAPGPHPVVIGFGGSEGGLGFGERIAETYASLGYVTLALAYFDAPGLPGGLTDVPLEYFDAAFTYLEGVDAADPTRIAVMGASRGGELALLLGAHYPQVTAVVALVPSGLVWGSADAFDAHAWTWEDVGLPYVPNSDAVPEVSVGPEGKPLYHLTPTFLDSMAEATDEQLEAAAIAVENTAGPVLLIGGEADGLWPSCALADVAMERLETSGHAARYDDRNVCFEDAGHFTNPLNAGFPMTTASFSYNPQFDAYYLMGGTPQGLGHAARASFQEVEAFLGEALAE